MKEMVNHNNQLEMVVSQAVERINELEADKNKRNQLFYSNHRDFDHFPPPDGF
jgi:hypothetical protein